LESVEGGAVRGRYSIIGIEPDLLWRADGRTVRVNRQAAHAPEDFQALPGDPLTALRTLINEGRMQTPEGLPAALATLVGYMGYETAGLVERLPAPKTDVLGVPDMLFMRPGLIAVFDRLKDNVSLVAPVYPASGVSARAAYERAIERIERAEAKLAGQVPGAYRLPEPLPEAPASANLSPDAYRANVLKAKEYIAAGDIFQVVLSQRFQRPFPLPPFELYRSLRRINPSPFLYFLDFKSFAVIGSSPEILVRVRDGDVTVRPIAGTRPRGATPEEDQANHDSLLADPKELAEHLMLLDLGRNDVGRVAKPGSVRVTERNIVERYSHVMHIVSNVRGVLDAQKHDAIDALMAGFPAGTVSGAPKIRAMEIIHELEPDKRGPYAGGVGYVSPDGAMDSCIVLRTAIVKDGVMSVQAGAGVVADSDPAYEQRECENKARALIKAADDAIERALAVGKRQ
jgi:anthranilate synthase component I